MEIATTRMKKKHPCGRCDDECTRRTCLACSICENRFHVECAEGRTEGRQADGRTGGMSEFDNCETKSDSSGGGGGGGGISLEEAGVQNARRVVPGARRAVEERIGEPASGRRIEVIYDFHCLLSLAARAANGQ